MITRWTFYFDQENIRSDVSNESESQRIADFIKDGAHGLLELPGNQADIFVNLKMVKCIVKALISDEQLAQEKAAIKAPVEPTEVANVS